MKAFAFLLLPFVLLAAAGCRPAAAPVSVSNRSKTEGVVPQTNLPLPVIKNVERLGWDTFDGRPERLGDFQGKAVVLDFWATYCPPCLEEIPHLVELQRRHQGELQIVGLHVGGAEDRPKVPAFVEKLKINYTLAYPQDALSEGLLGNDPAIPQTFVFDKNGKLIKKFVGYNDEIKAELEQAVADAIK